MISIRRQLTRNLLVVFLVLLGGALVALCLAAEDELIEQFDDALRAKASAISSLTVQNGEKVRVDISDRLFRSFSKEHPRDFFEIWGADGKPLARSESLGDADLARPEKPNDRWQERNIQLPNGAPGRALYLYFTPDQEEGESRENASNARLSLAVASDRGSLDEALTEFLGIGGGCAVLLLVATWWLVPRVLRRGLQPLDSLGEQTARIDADSLTSRFPTGNLPVELLPIAGRLNELLSRLEVSFERERRFSADLAHELRTPLAELRSLAECALKWPESRDQLTDQETLAIAKQMQAIVTSLLALVRGEQQQLVSQSETVDLAVLAQEIWHPLAKLADERQLKVNLRLAPVQVQADPALFRSILRNLMENAVDYAPVGGEIYVVVESIEAGPVLRITNSTESLEPDDVAKLFDRFWRKEEARSGGRHFGLGLSLARMFAKVMGWTLTATMDKQRRLEFTLAGPGEVSAGKSIE